MLILRPNWMCGSCSLEKLLYVFKPNQNTIPWRNLVRHMGSFSACSKIFPVLATKIPGKSFAKIFF